MTRSASKREALHELGATPVLADALDREQVARAVAGAAPEVIVHELTAPACLDVRHFDRDFAVTNRPRTEGTDHLLTAGRAVGVRRFVAQELPRLAVCTRGRAGQTEDDPLGGGLGHNHGRQLSALGAQSEGESTALTITPLAGGTDPVAASLMIEQLN